jgi:hypothetical protein
MRRFSFAGLGRKPRMILALIGGGLLILVMAGLLLWPSNSGPNPSSPTTSPRSPLPTPTPTLVPHTSQLDPRHGIHAPIGGQWTDPQRQALSAFKDANGQPGAPGLGLALSSDVLAANNSAHARMEEDLHQYARQGTEIYIRLYPQRFPGGYSERVETAEGRNTISGSPQDAAEDIFTFVDGQQRRNGWHFTRIIPGNEPNIEWPNQLYAQNLLPWLSNGDPAKYAIMNKFYIEVYQAWQTRLTRPDAGIYRDVELYFPPLAQDATPDSPNFYASFNFYEGSGTALRPVGNRYDPLREAIELYRRLSWHNYFEPGRACQDVATAAFPDWLKRDLESGWPAVIGEVGWSPEKLALPTQHDSRAILVKFWQQLGVKWEKKLYVDERPQWRTYDEVVDGARFEDDLRDFTGGCYRAGLKLPRPAGIAIWLAGSDGNFIAALGVEPGPTGAIRRWLQAYANFPL